jgi:hypothetical protein
MENEHYSIIDALYDSNIEKKQYTDLSIQTITLIHDRFATACRKRNLSVDSILMLRLFVLYMIVNNIRIESN